MSNRIYTAEQQARLRHLIDEGAQVLTEIEALKGGLSDTVKSIADELDVRPAILNKAIKVAYKQSFNDERDQFEELETILASINKV